MGLSESVKEKIAFEVISTLVRRFDSFPEDSSDNRNAPFHEAFLNAFSDKLANKVVDIPFFISLTSWFHGLNTTIGQSFFENIAHAISAGEKREYTSKRLGFLEITMAQKNAIDEIMTNLDRGESPSLSIENQMLKHALSDMSLVSAKSFSADIYFEDECNITAIELKSVKPNSGEMKGEKAKILEGKAALMKTFPEKEINFYIGFPFDPTNKSDDQTDYNEDDFFDNVINLSKYFAKEEALIASRFWNTLSGSEGTMEEILSIINTISTPKFMDKYQLLLTCQNVDNGEYRAILEEWNLYSELYLLNNKKELEALVKTTPRTARIYNNLIFQKDGKYNQSRFDTLSKLLN